MITTWYLQSQRTWDKRCHSCIGSSFLPRGAFPEGRAYAVSQRLHAGSLEALRVSRPEAVVLVANKRVTPRIARCILKQFFISKIVDCSRVLENKDCGFGPRKIDLKDPGFLPFTNLSEYEGYALTECHSGLLYLASRGGSPPSRRDPGEPSGPARRARARLPSQAVGTRPQRPRAAATPACVRHVGSERPRWVPGASWPIPR